jgi:hypothetical protein
MRRATLHAFKGVRRSSLRSDAMVADPEKFAQLRESGGKKRAGV